MLFAPIIGGREFAICGGNRKVEKRRGKTGGRSSSWGQRTARKVRKVCKSEQRSNECEKIK